MQCGLGRVAGTSALAPRCTGTNAPSWKDNGHHPVVFRARDVKKKANNRIRQSHFCIAYEAASEERRKSAQNDGWGASSESSQNDPGPSASCRAKRPIQVPSAGGAIRRRRVMIGLHAHSPMSRLLDFCTCRGYRDDEKHPHLCCFAVWHVGTVWGTTTGVECTRTTLGGIRSGRHGMMLP